MPDSSKQEDNLTHIGKRIIHASLLLFAGVFLFLAQSAMWVNNTIFDQETFTEIGTNVIMSQESRDAIAQTIVDEAFRERPVADRLIGDRAVSFISGLLGSDISERALSRVATSTYTYITSPDRQDIAIDLSAIREPISGIVSFAESRGREVEFDPASIPERIVFVESDELPDIYSYIRFMLLSSLILWVSTIVLFAAYVFWNKDNRIRRVYHVGAAILVSAIFGIALGPFLPPVIQSFVANIGLRGLIGDLTAAYIYPFTRQMYLTVALTVLAIAIVRFRWVFVKSWHSVYQSVTSRVKSEPKPQATTKKVTKKSK